MNKKDNTIQIVLSSNDNYIIGLAATIKSIIYHSSNHNKYVINILYTDISDANKEKINKLAKKNTEINFIDINSKINLNNSDFLYTHSYISIETYYRLFMPEIFNGYEKIIYVDCDLILRDDIAKLYSQELDGNILGAIINPTSDNENTKEYRREVLNVDEDKYFNAGVLLVDIQKFIENNIKNKCFELLKNEIKEPRCWDQDLLNVVCKNRVKYLDAVWNVQWTSIVYPKNFSKETRKMVQKSILSSKILHFTTNIKPWSINKINTKALYLYVYIITLLWYFYAFQTEYLKKAFVHLLKNSFAVLFMIEKNQTHKIIKILGIKLKIKRGK